MKTTVITIINSLLLGILLPNILEQYIISGYRNQTIISAIIGTILGTIICTQSKIQKVLYWLLLGAGLFSIAFFYTQQFPVWYISPTHAYSFLLLLLFFFTGFSYLLAFFELFVVKLFEKD